MTTPKKELIVERAKEIWFNEQWQNGNHTKINPTESELKECGAFSQAVSELMRDQHISEIESQFIDFPQDFNVDLKELYESNGLVLGSRHTGKSDIAMMTCERAMKGNAIVVVFDPSLDWIQRSPITQYIKVEPYTNLEVPNESIIYDLSLCSPLKAQKIVEDFNEKLFESQVQATDRKQYLVIFEESHSYFFQGVMRAKRMQNSVKLLSVGRNVDIAVLLISQFPSMIDKFCVKHAMSQSWYGFTREPNDLKYLKLILGETSDQLPKLNDGEFLYLTRSGLSKIQIEPYKNNIAKMEIKPKRLKPMIEPIKKPKQTKDSQALFSFLAMLIYAVVILAVMH